MRQTALKSLVISIFYLSAPTSLFAASPYYQGKNVVINVGARVGSSTDGAARLIATHMKRFLLGARTIVVRNRPGGSGSRAAEWFYSRAPKDGTELILIHGRTILDKVENPNRKFDPLKMTWLGRLNIDVQFGVVRAESSVKTIAEAKLRLITLTAQTKKSLGARAPWALNATIGTKFKVITGYSGPGKTLALERGEVEGAGAVTWPTIKRREGWADQKNINFLYVIMPTRFAAVPNIPAIPELSTNQLDQLALKLLSAPSLIGRALAGPPGLPISATKELRLALALSRRGGLAAAGMIR